jgi:hypothetical protein
VQDDLVVGNVRVQAGVAEAGGAHGLAGLVDQAVQVLFFDGVEVNLQQQIAAAAQIQAQVHLAPGHEAGEEGRAGP